jgi:uncharacterized protein (DUF983 family)
MKKSTVFHSIFFFRCPRCREGAFFKSHPYDLRKVGDMHEHCSACGLKYEKEPGFYYGAMYVAYALGVALFVTLWTSFNLFAPSVSVGIQIAVIVLATILLGPYIYALSKIMWANLFIPYDENAITKFKEGDPH